MNLLNELKKNTQKTFLRKKSSAVYFLLLLLLTILCYWKFWGNTWYGQDDYWRASTSIWDEAGHIISSHHHQENRYQPVRLFLFTLVTHWGLQEYSFFYNFSMHLINILLLFLLIRAFKVREVTAFLATALFSVYGVFTMIGNPDVMINGSGLNAFFILATLLFFLKGLASSSRGWKFIFLAFSYLSYLGLIFSYEVAFPMLATVVCAFLFFDRFFQGRPILSSPKGYWALAPFLLFLAIYYFLFCSHPSTYGGAQISVSPNILTKFLAYSKTLLSPFYHIDLPLQSVILLSFVLYYLGLFWVWRITKADHSENTETIDECRNEGLLFLFGGVWYISSVSLFTLNNLKPPPVIMYHHLYLMTVGVAMMIPSLFFMISKIFISPVKKIYRRFILYILLPFLLSNSINYHWHYAQDTAIKTKVLMGQLKNQPQTYPSNGEKMKALIVHSNFTGREPKEGVRSRFV